MSNNIDIKIKAKTEGTSEVKKLETQLSALGKIESFKKLKKDVQDSETAWASAQAEVSKLAKEIKSADTPTKAMTANFAAAKKEAAKLKTEFLQNQKSLQTLRTSLSNAGISTKTLSTEQKKLSTSVSKTRDELSKIAKIDMASGLLNVKSVKDVEREIKALKDAYVTLKNSGNLSMTELAKAKQNMKSRISDLKSETTLWAGSISKVNVGLAALAAAGYAAMKSFSGYSEFSQRMAEVNTLVDISTDKFGSMSDEILNMSTRIPQTASELASAEYDIISAGVALEESTKVLELSAKAAVAGVTDTKTAVNAGVGVINAYGKDIGELGHVYDVLFKTVKSGVTTFPQLSEHIGEVLPTARAAGVEFEDVAASIATMTKAGIKTPQAATAIKGAINAMAAPAPEAKKKFDELGITWEGLIPTLEAIRQKGLSVDQMRMLIPDVEARNGVLSLTQNMEGLKQVMAEMSGASGAMQAAYNKMKDTPENQMKLFKNEVSKLNIEIGGLVSKALLPAAGKVRQFLGSFDTGSITKMKEAADETMQKFAEFKDVKLPGDITTLAQADLDSFKQKLENAKVYWEALRSKLQADAEQTTWFGTATKEAIEAQAILKNVDQRINEIDNDLNKLKTSGESAAEGMKKPAEAVKATEEQLKDFEKQAKAAYKAAIAEAKKYADEVIAWEEKIRDARLSTTDKLRELSRKTMTDEQAWNDERLQADEKLYAAKEALRNGDYDLAEKLAKDAEGLYAGLAEEIKSSTDEGDQAVVKSLESTTQVAKNGVQAVGDFMSSLYGKQKENAQTAQKTWEDTAATIASKLAEITAKREASITIKLENLEDARNKINDLVRDEDKKITLKIVKEVTTVETEAKQTGGPVGFARGGRLPGYGGGDRIRALLEAGEFVIRKEAVSKYGAGLFHALNAMKADFPNMIKARVGGLISNLSIPSMPVQKFATGGMAMAGGPSETLVVRFQAGDVEAPVRITDPDSRMAIKQLAKEMSRLRMIHV